MTGTRIVVGLDGSPSGERALAFAKEKARQIGDCTIMICYVIEWSPFSFQTAEENAARHLRREEEIATATTRVVDPAVAATRAEGLAAEGIVQHGDVAEILDEIAVAQGGSQIIIGRVGAKGLKERLFGGVSGRLIATASVPVTIIP